MFKGTIPIGTPVTARLEVSDDAAGSAVLALAWSGGGQTGEHAECRSAPGGSCTVTVTPGMKGLLRVVVDMNSETDTRILSVAPVTPPEPIVGDTTWLYTVE